MASEVEPKEHPVLVDGATGYLGSHLVHRLIKAGYPVSALAHSGASRKDMEYLSSLGAQVFIGNLNRPDTSEALRAFNRCKTAIHLIGSIAPKRGEKLEDLHVQQTASFVQCAKRAEVGTVMMVTALGTRADAPSNYHRTKFLAEEEIRKSELNYTILRPSLLVGRIVGNRDSKLVRRYREIILTKMMVPLLNGGGNLLQPLFIGDMVEAAYRVLTYRVEALMNTEIELGGPEEVSMRQFVETYMDVLGKKKPIVTLHPGLAGIAAGFSELLQDVPTLSRDQLTLSLSDNVCENNAIETLLHISPQTVREALESYSR